MKMAQDLTTGLARPVLLERPNKKVDLSNGNSRLEAVDIHQQKEKHLRK